MPHTDDLLLIRRVAVKDCQAFEVLYHRYYWRLFGYLSKLIERREIVEEVLHDVMITVWNSASRFNNTSQPSTWIFGIAYHKALKALARMTKELAEIPLVAPKAPDQEDGESFITRQEMCSTVARALRALSPEQRVVVELTFYHGFSYQEIAEMVDCPVNTVKTRMFHARRRLEQLLLDLGMRRQWQEEHQ